MLIYNHLYDTSDYPLSHPAYNTINKKVLGKMKDETNGRPIKEFVGLRPKMYAIMESDNSEKKTAKGINKSVTKQLRHQSYYDTLFGEKSSYVDMSAIRSFHHTVMSVSIRKLGLSPYDNKRYVLGDKITTLAHGHYKIKQENVPIV
jgi:hypothetical protein